MTQSQLNAAVAAATGESRRTIRQRGFSIADPLEAAFDAEPGDVVKFLDWDEVAGTRHRQLAIY